MGTDKITVPTPGVDGYGPGDPPWLKTAFADLGEAEVAGPNANPRILEYFEATYQKGQHKDDTGAPHAWCAAFVTWHLAESKFKTKKAVGAREYLMYGEPCNLFRGAIVVLERKGQKHVAFCVGQDRDGHPVFLGGNQANKVSLATFPLHRVLAVRKPHGYTVPERLARLPTVVAGGETATV